jgi:ribonucleoside-triphosphate reductase
MMEENKRSDAIDFYKGFLIITMILCHCIQFFGEEGGGAGGGDPQGGQNPQNTDPQGQPNAGQQGNDGSQNNQPPEHMIPKSRFDEVNNQMKTLQEQLDAFTKEKEKADLDAKKKKGEFEELYNTASQELENTKNTYKQTSERVTQLEGIIQTLVDTELEAVPEELRDLIPEGFTPEQKLSWITQAKTKGLFGATQNRQNEPVGGATNNQQPPQQDISKMGVHDLFRSAYGTK